MEFVTLRRPAALVLPAAALTLALDLEARGHVITPHPEALDRIRVSHGSALSAADKAAITTHRLHLAALCRLDLDPATVARETDPPA